MLQKVRRCSVPITSYTLKNDNDDLSDDDRVKFQLLFS